MAKEVPMKGGLPINEDEKAETIAIFTPSITCKRPYMRGFHGAWLSAEPWSPGRRAQGAAEPLRCVWGPYRGGGVGCTQAHWQALV